MAVVVVVSGSKFSIHQAMRSSMSFHLSICNKATAAAATTSQLSIYQHRSIYTTKRAVITWISSTIQPHDDDGAELQIRRPRQQHSVSIYFPHSPSCPFARSEIPLQVLPFKTRQNTYKIVNRRLRRRRQRRIHVNFNSVTQQQIDEQHFCGPRKFRSCSLLWTNYLFKLTLSKTMIIKHLRPPLHPPLKLIHNHWPWPRL